jgi:hypothetical protein
MEGPFCSYTARKQFLYRSRCMDAKSKKPCSFLYREYLLAYFDDIVIMSHDPHTVIYLLPQCITFKPGSVKPAKSYLRADVFQITIHNGGPSEPAKQVWVMSAKEYIKRSIQG